MRYIQTVNGKITPDELGITLPHEHLIIDYTKMLVDYDEDEIKDLKYEKINCKNRNLISKYFNANLDNMKLDNINIAVNEINFFKKHKGNTIVEVTTIGIGRNVIKLQKISQKSGINIISGTGFYTQPSNPYPPWFFKSDKKKLTNYFINEIINGIDDTNICAGFIGEIGCSYPLHPDEYKVLVSSIYASKELNTCLMIHPGRSEKSINQIIKVLKEHNANYEKIILCHIERTVFSFNNLKSILNLGINIEFDLFGWDLSYVHLRREPPVHVPDDYEKVKTIKKIIDLGFEKQILISHDIHNKHRLVKYGGHGYHHILRDVIPVLMKINNFSKDSIKNIIINNPKRIFTIN